MQAKAYINGAWINKQARVEIISPETNQVIGSVPALNQSAIAEAFRSARAAQKKWELTPLATRAKILKQWATILAQESAPIAELMTREIAKPLAAAKAEITRSVQMIHETIATFQTLVVKKIAGYTIGAPTKDVTIILKPLGVILAIAPFNYPINLAVAKIIPALISGNTIVFKPATNGSLVGSLLATTLAKAGIPPGVFNFVTGRGREIGTFLTTNDEINGISFTGSTQVGVNLSKQAKMAIIVLELGGKDAAYVRKDADLELAAREIIKGAFAYSGQRCTALKRVLVEKSVAAPLLALLSAQVAQLKVGQAINNADITAVIDRTSRDYILELVADALAQGAVPHAPLSYEGNLIQPLILSAVTTEMKIAWEEQFGPVLPIISVQDDAAAIRIANNSKYGLQSSIFTTDLAKAHQLAPQFEVGSLNINGASQRGPDALPFTGVKLSGLNVQGIAYALQTMTRPFNMIVNKSQTRTKQH